MFGIRQKSQHPFDTSDTSKLAQAKLTPSQQVNVTSVYNTLPINAISFYKNGGVNTESINKLIETATFSIIVPNGKVAVVRNIAFSFGDIYVDGTFTSCNTQISIDDLPLEYNDAINRTQDTGINGLDFFFIAGSAKTIKVTTVRTSPITYLDRGLVTLPSFFCQIKGEFLNSRNLPPNMEIGSFK